MRSGGDPQLLPSFETRSFAALLKMTFFVRKSPMPLSDSIAPDAYRAPSQEQIARARAMYAEGFTVSRILAHCDMALGTLYYWLDGGPQQADGPALPPIPRRREIVGKRRRTLRGDAASLSARLWRTCERQARDIEERLRRGGTAPDERDMRMLSLLVRALRDLKAFDADARQAEPAAPAALEPEVDMDELRARLLQRILALKAEHAQGG